MEFPAGPTAPERALDFIVLGVQKGGTTSLWEYLRSHPKIVLPEYKEMPVFCVSSERFAGVAASFIDDMGRDAPPDALLGKVATHYMMGTEEASVERIAERIAGTFPDVRLIVLLRDPIERAMSHYRMSVRRGWENRTFDTVVEELLDPECLMIGRTQPTETNSYLAQGEYGRILSIYLNTFPPEQIHVESTSDLDREPGRVIDRILAFLGLPPGHRPADLEVHHFRGGTRPLLSEAAEEQLFAFFEEHIWPRVGDDVEHLRLTFNFFYETWNVVSDDERPPLSSSNRKRLEAHYEADAENLVTLGMAAPWLGEWHAQGADALKGPRAGSE